MRGETRHENHESRLDGHAFGEKQDGQTTRNQVAASDGVGDMLFYAHFATFFWFAKIHVFQKSRIFAKILRILCNTSFIL